MRFQLFIALVAILPSAFCDPTAGNLDTPNANTFDTRAEAAVNFAPLPRSPTNPYFMVTRLDAFMPSAGSPLTHSRAGFVLRLMHPDMLQRWTTRCFALTEGELCGPDKWTVCRPVAGDRNKNETLSFMLDANMSRLTIKRRWTYNGQWLNTLASEPANWVLKANAQDLRGNVTLSEDGLWYQKPEGWVIGWDQTWG